MSDSIASTRKTLRDSFSDSGSEFEIQSQYYYLNNKEIDSRMSSRLSSSSKSQSSVAQHISKKSSVYRKLLTHSEEEDLIGYTSEGIMSKALKTPDAIRRTKGMLETMNQQAKGGSEKIHKKIGKTIRPQLEKVFSDAYKELFSIFQDCTNKAINRIESTELQREMVHTLGRSYEKTCDSLSTIAKADSKSISIIIQKTVQMCIQCFGEKDNCNSSIRRYVDSEMQKKFMEKIKEFEPKVHYFRAEQERKAQEELLEFSIQEMRERNNVFKKKNHSLPDLISPLLYQFERNCRGINQQSKIQKTNMSRIVSIFEAFVSETSRHCPNQAIAYSEKIMEPKRIFIESIIRSQATIISIENAVRKLGKKAKSSQEQENPNNGPNNFSKSLRLDRSAPRNKGMSATSFRKDKSGVDRFYWSSKQ